MTKLTAYISLIFLLVTLLACNKQSTNPCNGILNESPPKKVGLLLYHKITGDNLVLSKPIEETDIKVIALPSGNTVNNWRLLKAANSPFNGMLEMAVFHESAGQHAYKIEIKGMATFAIAYAISQEKTDDPCKTYAYPMSELKSTDHDFEPLVLQDKPIPNFIKVYF